MSAKKAPKKTSNKENEPKLVATSKKVSKKRIVYDESSSDSSGLTPIKKNKPAATKSRGKTSQITAVDSVIPFASPIVTSKLGETDLVIPSTSESTQSGEKTSQRTAVNIVIPTASPSVTSIIYPEKQT